MMDEIELRAEILEAGGQFLTCAKCGGEFIVGLRYQRRNDSRFCTPNCRWDFHNAKRKFLNDCQAEGVAR